MRGRREAPPPKRRREGSTILKKQERERERALRSHFGSSSLHSELASNGTIRGFLRKVTQLSQLAWPAAGGVRPVPAFGAVAASSGTPRKRSVVRDSVGKMSAVFDAEELRLVVRRLAGSIMWDRGAVILGKRTGNAFPSASWSRQSICQRRRSQENTPTSDVSPSIRTVVSTSMVRTTRTLSSISRWPQCLSTNRPFINQVTKHVVTPPPVVMQRQVPQVQTALKTVEAPPAQFVGRVVDVSVTMQARQVTKEVEIPQTSYLIDHVVGVPVVMLRQVLQVQTVLNTQFVGRVVEVPVITQVRQVTKQVESPRRGKVLMDVPVNGLTQVTMKLRCCRATHAFRRPPAKNRGLF